jgi:hypothetical protein
MDKKDYYRDVLIEVSDTPEDFRNSVELTELAANVAMSYISRDLEGKAFVNAAMNLASEYINNLYMFAVGIGFVPRTDDVAKKMNDPEFDFVSEFLVDSDPDCACLTIILEWYTTCVCNAAELSLAKLG